MAPQTETTAPSRLWLTLAVFTAILLWAGFRIATTTPTADEAPIIATSRPRPAPVPRHDPPSIAASDIRFSDEAFRSEFLRYDEAVRRMPDRGWTRTPGELFAPDGGNLIWQKVWQGSGRVVSLGVTLRRPSEECDQFEFRAATFPREGWGAGLNYQQQPAASTRPREFFLLITPPRRIAGGQSPDGHSFSVTPEDARFSAQFEHATRRFGVSVLQPGRKEGIRRTEIASYLESAESLRTAARQETLRLKTHGEQTLATGKGFVEWVDAPADVRVPGGKVPRHDPLVGDDVRQEALKLFRAEMETRLEWIDTHSAEMHAAVLDLFPGVRELLLP